MKATLRRVSSNNNASVNDSPTSDCFEVPTPLQMRKNNGASQSRRGQRMTGFSADTPYFRTYVDREVDKMSILQSTLLEIAKNAREFEKCSVAMVDATRNLSASCKLQSYSSTELAMMGVDSGDISELQVRRGLFTLKKECLGDEMYKVLTLLGEVLDEVANAQLQMCQSLHASLSDPLEAFVENDIAEVYRCKNEAYAATDLSEKAYSQYIHGRSIDNRDLSTQTVASSRGSTAGGRVSAAFMDIKSGIKAGIKTARNGGNPDEPGESNIRFTINYVCSSLVQAELSRFHVLRSLDTLKTRRDFELGESTLASLIGIKAYFHHCSDLTQGLTPRYDMIQIEQAKIKKRLEEQHIPWETQRLSLNNILNEFSSPNETSDEVRVKHEIKCRKELEDMFGIWNLSRRFEEFSVYQREASEKIAIEGWLYKYNTSRMAISAWNRRWFIVDDSGIYYIKRDENHNSRAKVCDIVLCSVKQNDDDCFCFELVSPNNKPLMLKTPSPNARAIWINSIKKCIETNLGKSFDKHRDSSSSTEIVIKSSSLQMPTWNPRGDIYENVGVLDVHPNVGNTSVRLILEKNRVCADCGRENPDWVSLNLCVLICIECSGIHRSLGVHLSKVRSMKMDDLSKHECMLLLATGNEVGNNIYEANIPAGWCKPLPNNDRESKEKWIKSKYVWKGFISFNSQPSGTEELSSRLYLAAQNGDLFGVMNAFIKGADTNWKNVIEDGRSALHACAVSKKKVGKVWNGLECAEFLIQNGAKPDIYDNEQRSPIDLALVEGGDIEFLDYFNNQMKV